MVLEFQPDVHKTVWGEEEWLVSVHPRGPSLLADGSGRSLCEIAPDFPLLIKRIRAEKRLSVQVHPNDLTVKYVGGEAKTEMWCVLRPGPIFAGFKPGTTAGDVTRAVADGSFEDLLVRYDAKVGECYFIPGGLVHAIGEGTSVFEVQQSSDTTYRLYDWGRVGLDGLPRKLHVNEALSAMDLTLPPPVPSGSVSCPYFDFLVVPEGGYELNCEDWSVVYDPARNVCRFLSAGERCSCSSGMFVTRRGAGYKGKEV